MKAISLGSGWRGAHWIAAVTWLIVPHISGWDPATLAASYQEREKGLHNWTRETFFTSGLSSEARWKQGADSPFGVVQGECGDVHANCTWQRGGELQTSPLQTSPGPACLENSPGNALTQPSEADLVTGPMEALRNIIIWPIRCHVDMFFIYGTKPPKKYNTLAHSIQSTIHLDFQRAPFFHILKNTALCLRVKG